MYMRQRIQFARSKEELQMSIDDVPNAFKIWWLLLYKKEGMQSNQL